MNISDGRGRKRWSLAPHPEVRGISWIVSYSLSQLKYELLGTVSIISCFFVVVVVSSGLLVELVDWNSQTFLLNQHRGGNNHHRHKPSPLQAQ